MLPQAKNSSALGFHSNGVVVGLEGQLSDFSPVAGYVGSFPSGDYGPQQYLIQAGKANLNQHQF